MALIIGRYTGLRVSETLALKKQDFDLENCCMTVRRKIEYSGLKAKDIHTTHQLKSAKSKGTVEISKLLCSYLKNCFYMDYEGLDVSSRIKAIQSKQIVDLSEQLSNFIN